MGALLVVYLVSPLDEQRSHPNKKEGSLSSPE